MGCICLLAVVVRISAVFLAADHVFDFFHFAPEVLIDFQLVLHHLAGMEHRRVVALGNELSNPYTRRVGVFLGQIHGYLTGYRHIMFTGTGVETLFLDVVVFAHFGDDGIDGNFFLLDFGNLLHHAFGEIDIDVLVVDC